ncbi:Ger(x)C family germination protein [Aneurinibacillus soli]|uniref:Spore germination protein B3 n=1 Tax=Aneurinibacillus soli TaxID=1500254 RepID=A0A0U5AX30_9BACL|nr:Ger(x)C family spore germination protein [Aneurinibacillus soli]PYE64333.1 Ger(x)C family germination protein [Aneurinibacillus soli]BAU28282.1 Spore germination protein B3 precursor [Aneurinibacillus soli]
MKKQAKLILLCFYLLFLSGCGDRLSVEETTLSLVYALDIDEKGKLTVYQLNPVFNKEAKNKYEIHSAKVNTNRQARQIFDSMMNGKITTGKVQVIMFSEHLLKKQGVMTLLDSIYRDAKNSGNMCLVVVKGPIAPLINSKFNDKPILPMYIKNVVDVGRDSNQGVFVTAQHFHKIAFDKGITPFITEIKKGPKALTITGSALLNKKGMYELSLDRHESALLLMLQKSEHPPVSFTMHMPPFSFKTPNPLQNKKGTDFTSIDVYKAKRKISITHEHNHFSFIVQLEMNVDLTERTFDMNVTKNKEQLEAILTKQFTKELNGLIKKAQKKQLDPFGFGWQARAYQYSEWKKVEDHWPLEFSKAKVSIIPVVKIKKNGVVE